MHIVVALLLLLAAPPAVLVAILVHSPRALMVSEGPHPPWASPPGLQSSHLASQIGLQTSEKFSYILSVMIFDEQIWFSKHSRASKYGNFLIL